MPAIAVAAAAWVWLAWISPPIFSINDDAIRDQLLVRDCTDWQTTLEYIDGLPEAVRGLALVREQRSLALSKAGDDLEAIAALETLVASAGDSSERRGLIAGRYKKLHDAATSEADRARYLDLAIDHYERGMALDLNDYYPSSNLPRLYRARGAPGDAERAVAAAHVARIACERARQRDPNDAWIRPTLLGAAFDAEDVRLLDGGYDAWVHDGHPVENVIRTPAEAPEFGVAIPLRPEVIVDLDEAKQILADPDGAALVSVRTWNEHIGKVSGYNYIVPAGRIAGDVWGNCGTDAYHMQHYRTVDNTMRSYVEIAANWKAAGITADKDVSFYCGTGWRAAETWFYAYIMGWPSISVYDGGWFEWSQDPENNPIEIGTPGDEVTA